MVLADVAKNCDALLPLAGRRDPSLLVRCLMVPLRNLETVVNRGTYSCWKMLV